MRDRPARRGAACQIDRVRRLPLLLASLASACGGGASAPSQVPSDPPAEPAPLAPLDVAVLGSVAKVRPEGAASGADRAILAAGRNEFESFQVAANAHDRPLRDLAIALASPLTGPGGEAIPAENVTIYRVEYYEVRTASDLEGAPGRWPDPLIPAVDPLVGEARAAFPVDVPAGENRVAWIDVRVPADATPGMYGGALEMRAAGFVASVPIELEVLDFALPSTTTLRSAFGLSDDACAPLGIEGCAGDPQLEARVRQLFARAALDDRVTLARPHTGRLSPASPGGAQAFRAWLLPLLDGTADTRLPGARLTTFQVNPVSDRTIAPWKSEAEAGRFVDRAFVWSCDEPYFFPDIEDPAGNWARCIDVLQQDAAAWPEVPKLVTAHIQTVLDQSVMHAIDIMVVNLEFLDGPADSPWYPGNQRPLYDAFLAQTDRPRELWLYSACGSHGCTRNDHAYTNGWAGGYQIDAPGAQTRAMPWLAFAYDADAVLYYDTILQLGSAWDDQYRYTGNGEGTLFYPGTPDRIGGSTPIPIECSNSCATASKTTSGSPSCATTAAPTTR